MNVIQYDPLHMAAGDNSRLDGYIDMGAIDRDIRFGSEGVVENQRNCLPSIRFTPAYDIPDAFPNSSEPPLSFEPSIPNEAIFDETTSGAPDATNPKNKLLSFGAPMFKAAAFDDEGQTWPVMSAELHGMFFIAKDVLNSETASHHAELTCYRRNLFQISGMIKLSRRIARMVDSQGQSIPICDLYATLTALESIGGKDTDIISVPWKKDNSIARDDRSRILPPSWPLVHSLNPELGPGYVCVPITWKRLQFKHATANNGRRKGLQQYYIIQLNLMATLPNGDQSKLCEIRSSPIMVRGRSPIHFDNRYEGDVESEPMAAGDILQPLSGDTTAVSNSGHQLSSPQLTLTHPISFIAPQLSRIQSPQKYGIKDLRGSSPILPYTSTNSSSTILNPAKKVNRAASSPDPLVGRSAPTMESLRMRSSGSSASVNVYVEGSDHRRSIGPGDGTATSSESSHRVVRSRELSYISHANDPDLLYEYLPLGLNEWMPVVDAIYRPHIVHHTNLSQDLGSPRLGSRIKRYFIA